MASEIVRNIRNVTSIDNMNLNVTEENDLVSDTEGNVYIRLKDKYEKLIGMGEDETEIQSMIDEIKEQIEVLQTAGNTSNQKINSINKQIKDLNTQLESKKDFTNEITELNNKINAIEIPNYDTKFTEYDTKIKNAETKITSNQNEINTLKQPQKSTILTDIDLQSIESLESAPIGQYYVNAKNKISEMGTVNGWLTVRDTGVVRSIEFQPYNHAKVFRTYIYQGKLGEWEWTLTNK